MPREFLSRIRLKVEVWRLGNRDLANIEVPILFLLIEVPLFASADFQIVLSTSVYRDSYLRDLKYYSLPHLLDGLS